MSHLGAQLLFWLPRGTVTPSSSVSASNGSGAVWPTPFVLHSANKPHSICITIVHSTLTIWQKENRINSSTSPNRNQSLDSNFTCPRKICLTNKNVIDQWWQVWNIQNVHIHIVRIIHGLPMTSTTKKW